MGEKLSTAEPAHGVPQPAQDQDCRVYTVPEAGKMAGLSRNGSYEAAKKGTIPTIQFGKLKKVPAAAWHRILGEQNRARSAG
jgi:hypothetical protein